jgi:hypothetical protein
MNKLEASLQPAVKGITLEHKGRESQEETDLRIDIGFTGPGPLAIYQPRRYTVYFSIIGPGGYLKTLTWQYDYSWKEMSRTMLLLLKTEFEPYKGISRDGSFNANLQLKLTKNNLLSALNEFKYFFMFMKNKDPNPAQSSLNWKSPVLKISYYEDVEIDPYLFQLMRRKQDVLEDLESGFKDFIPDETERKRKIDEAMEQLDWKISKESIDPFLKRQRRAAAKLLQHHNGDVEAAAQMLAKIHF